jgi:hypothetical protein
VTLDVHKWHLAGTDILERITPSYWLCINSIGTCKHIILAREQCRWRRCPITCYTCSIDDKSSDMVTSARLSVCQVALGDEGAWRRKSLKGEIAVLEGAITEDFKFSLWWRFTMVTADNDTRSPQNISLSLYGIESGNFTKTGRLAFYLSYIVRRKQHHIYNYSMLCPRSWAFWMDNMTYTSYLIIHACSVCQGKKNKLCMLLISAHSFIILLGLLICHSEGVW